MTDLELIAKIRTPITKEQFLKEHPDVIERNVRCDFYDMADDGKKLLEEKRQMELEEMEEEMELDNLLDGQVDDTVDETVEPLYCNAVYKANKRKAEAIKELIIPEKFFTWSQMVQDSWVASKIKTYGYEEVKKLFEEDK